MLNSASAMNQGRGQNYYFENIHYQNKQHFKNAQTKRKNNYVPLDYKEKSF